MIARILQAFADQVAMPGAMDIDPSVMTEAGAAGEAAAGLAPGAHL
jgi:hypothetical protein